MLSDLVGWWREKFVKTDHEVAASAPNLLQVGAIDGLEYIFNDTDFHLAIALRLAWTMMIKKCEMLPNKRAAKILPLFVTLIPQIEWFIEPMLMAIGILFVTNT